MFFRFSGHSLWVIESPYWAIESLYWAIQPSKWAIQENGKERLDEM
ncbi:MAG: hypothetical protein HPY66_0987 [Firmicutes bacterium]|nr:hypothetical protein [Bacillota bacterium]